MILDTSALAAIFFGEPEAARYTQIIHDAERCLISSANFLELSIVIEAQIGAEAMRQCDMFFRRAGIVIEPFTVEQAHMARQAFHDFGKGRHPAGLNFGDC
ncbi:MAG: type II toxin-antitoxin system VapC family toxin, partial [Bryobacteraceae bacterium]